MNADECEVLVVGAGAAGLTIALELACRGIRTRVIEKHLHHVHHSKAMGIHVRTMELLDTMPRGVVENFMPQCKQLDGFRWNFAGKRVEARNCNFDSKFAGIYVSPQWKFELVLIDQLEKLGVKVERGYRLADFEINSDVVCDIEKVTEMSKNMDEEIFVRNYNSEEIVKLTKSESTMRLKCKYLIGADGMHSTTRELMKVPFEGFQYQVSVWMADCKIKNYDKRFAEFFISSNGEASGVIPFDDEQCRVILMFKNTHSKVNLTFEVFQYEFQKRFEGHEVDGNPCGYELYDNIWLSQPRIYQKMVSNPILRRQVFLVGDAAHVHSPVGGQGMNMGIQDSFNLAWKIALVLRNDKIKEEILDSYAIERIPVWRTTIQGTERGTNVVFGTNWWSSMLRTYVIPYILSLTNVQRRFFLMVSQLQVGYVSDNLDEKNLLLAGVETRDSKVSFKQTPTAILKPGARAPDLEKVVESPSVVEKENKDDADELHQPKESTPTDPQNNASGTLEEVLKSEWTDIKLVGLYQVICRAKIESNPEFVLLLAPKSNQSEIWKPVLEKHKNLISMFQLDDDVSIERFKSIYGDNAYLIRPDCYVAWVGVSDKNHANKLDTFLQKLYKVV